MAGLVEEQGGEPGDRRDAEDGEAAGGQSGHPTQLVGGHAATATSASRASRVTAWLSAPAASRASVAWAIRRPVKPRDPATATLAVTSLPEGAGASSYETSRTIGPDASSFKPLASAAITSTSKEQRWPAIRPTTRAREPVTRRSPSRPSTSKSMGAHRPQAAGSVNTPRTSSGRPLEVICAVQVLMAAILDLQGFCDIALHGDLASPIAMISRVAEDHNGRPGSSSRMTPGSSLRRIVVRNAGATVAA